MQETYNDTASRVANELYSMSVTHPEAVEATKSHHRLETLAQAMLVAHLIRHMSVRIVTQETLNREWSLLDHEKEMLKSWTTGDTSLLPDGWSIEKQEAYILGIETTLNNLYANVN